MDVCLNRTIGARLPGLDIASKRNFHLQIFADEVQSLWNFSLRAEGTDSGAFISFQLVEV